MGYPNLVPSYEGNLITQLHEICLQETRDRTLSYGVNPESLSHLGFNRYWVVTDRRTDIITIASTRLALRTVAVSSAARAHTFTNFYVALPKKNYRF